jgi:PadR family transcriptional regulator, regulatory protein PadR
MAFRSDLESLILGVLQTEALHGYEIAKRIKEAGSEILAVGEGQLYPALHRLERDGLITATWVPQEGRPARKVYSLTEGGSAELSDRRKLWENFANSVNRVLNSPRPAKEAS